MGHIHNNKLKTTIAKVHVTIYLWPLWVTSFDPQNLIKVDFKSHENFLNYGIFLFAFIQS